MLLFLHNIKCILCPCIWWMNFHLSIYLTYHQAWKINNNSSDSSYFYFLISCNLYYTFWIYLKNLFCIKCYIISYSVNFLMTIIYFCPDSYRYHCKLVLSVPWPSVKHYEFSVMLLVSCISKWHYILYILFSLIKPSNLPSSFKYKTPHTTELSFCYLQIRSSLTIT